MYRYWQQQAKECLEKYTVKKAALKVNGHWSDWERLRLKKLRNIELLNCVLVNIFQILWTGKTSDT
jgi:hypothetical protein